MHLFWPFTQPAVIALARRLAAPSCSTTHMSSYPSGFCCFLPLWFLVPNLARRLRAVPAGFRERRLRPPGCSGGCGEPAFEWVCSTVAHIPYHRQSLNAAHALGRWVSSTTASSFHQPRCTGSASAIPLDGPVRVPSAACASETPRRASSFLLTKIPGP